MTKIRPTLCEIKTKNNGKDSRFSLDYRPAVSSTLPMYLDGYIGIKPDDTDVASVIDGIKHRVGGITPDLDMGVVAEFKTFVSRFLKKYFPIMDANTDVSVETYINDLDFDMARKDQLREAYQNVQKRSKKQSPLDVKSFIKEETYFDPKAFRTINSRIDEYKVQVGPWIHAVEKLAFKMKWFIKTIPVASRSSHIINALERLGRTYMATDFTAFESSFRKEIMEAAEFQLFEYMTQSIPGANDFMDLYRQIALTNKLLFKSVVARIACKRMSGEMSTSIANGFTNLCLILFTAYKEGLNIDDLDLFVEGDDSIISAVKKLTTKWFEKLGFICKMETYSSVRKASFCGLIFSEPGHIIRDPRPVLAKFGWAMRQYVHSNEKTRMALLRAKAMSLACEMPNCPILSVFAHRVMELTRSINLERILLKANNQSFDMYHRVMLCNAVLSKPWQQPPNILPESRVLMEEKFGIDVFTQLSWEQRFSTLTLEPIQLPAADCFFPRDWQLNWDMYVSARNTPWDSGVVRNLGRLDNDTTFLPDTSPFDYRGRTPPSPREGGHSA